MNDDILNTLLKDTYTISLLKHRLRILKSNLLRKFFGGEAPEQLSAQELDWLNSLPSSFYQKFNKDNVYQIFDALEVKINSMPVLLIYIPFEADNQAIYQIGMTLRKSFTTLSLFEIKINPALIAGCALSFQGIYRDYSIRAKIEEKKTAILESLKRFKR